MTSPSLALVGAILTAVVVGATALILGSAATITLIAEGPIEVQEWLATESNQARTVGYLKAGDEVVVVACEDLKHYIAPVVRLHDGTTGYVFTGSFRLKREPPWSIPGKPTALGCWS
jgi:hypothetical protein